VLHHVTGNREVFAEECLRFGKIEPGQRAHPVPVLAADDRIGENRRRGQERRAYGADAHEAAGREFEVLVEPASEDQTRARVIGLRARSTTSPVR
jgi:hypothetical protein